MITGVDAPICAGCGEPLPVDAETTEYRQYNEEDGLLVADITCRCGVLNFHPMPGHADEVKHRGRKVYHLDQLAPQDLYTAAAKAGVPVRSIGSMSHKRAFGQRMLPAVTMFLKGQPDPALARAEVERLVDSWSEDLDLDAVLAEFAARAA